MKEKSPSKQLRNIAGVIFQATAGEP